VGGASASPATPRQSHLFKRKKKNHVLEYSPQSKVLLWACQGLQWGRRGTEGLTFLSGRSAGSLGLLH
jgi:hypothetical protein